MMARTAVLLLAILLLLCACTHMQKGQVPIVWPDNFDYMEALCDIDVMMKDLQYSGEMSLKVKYPDSIFMEVYGPFGNTILTVSRSGGHFLMHTDDREITDENEFYRMFRININDIIEDLTLKGFTVIEGDDRYKQRGDYRIFYRTNDNGGRICWKRPGEDFCINFLEVSFSKGDSIGKSDRGEQ